LKGSPEKVYSLCDKNSIPDNFTSVLNSYASKGFRVIGLACKEVKMGFD
jgi:magnesium-transporting ATPase (P-type)